MLKHHGSSSLSILASIAAAFAAAPAAQAADDYFLKIDGDRRRV